MEKVRIGVIGMGNMGTGHSRYLVAGKVLKGELTAVCDISPQKLKKAKEWLGIKYFILTVSMLCWMPML